ncbi:MAG TPA: hypothetical protein VFL03_13710 [Candidatus Limnocylindrales bacterium]|nr:hypothetical protein [Candidatus Limnocylindrales bacterium]
MCVVVQVFVALRDAMPAVAALHPMSGFLILLVSIVMARAAWAAARAASVGSPDAAAPATVPA